MLADAHCHLDWFDNPKKVLENAKKEGVESVFSCSTNLESMKKHMAFSGLNGLKIALGIHPGDLLKMTPDQANEAIAFLEKNISKADAVGEIGLDFKYAKTKEERAFQETVFRQQVKLAVGKNLPLVVHARYCEKKVIELLAEMNAKKVLLHWFTTSEEFVSLAAKQGFFMSCGPIIFSSEQAAGVSDKIPLDLLLLETDAPVEFGGMPSEPFWVKRVAEETAKRRKISFEKIVQITGKNYQSLFAP